MARFLVLALMMAVFAGCSTTSIVKRWHVHPDDMALFDQTARRCSLVAHGHRAEDMMDLCMQNAGFRLEVIQN